LQVSRTTARAKAAVEAADGTVRLVYYNKLGNRSGLRRKAVCYQKQHGLRPSNEIRWIALAAYPHRQSHSPSRQRSWSLQQSVTLLV